MLRVNEARFLVQYDVRVYVFQSKNRVMINVSVNVQNWMIKVILKMITFVFLVRMIVDVTFKINKHFDIKVVHAKTSICM